jgi:manganese transport protein
VTLLTLAAEIGGIALAVQLMSGVNYLVWVPIAAIMVWLVIWRMRFRVLENLFGILGLTVAVTLVALWHAHPDWSAWPAARCTRRCRRGKAGRPTGISRSRCWARR